METDRAQIARFGEQPPLDALPTDDDHGNMTAWGWVFAAGVLLFTAVGGYIVIQLGLAVLHYWGAQ